MYLKLMNESYENIFKNINRPYYVYLSLTNMCNANCVFCDVRENDKKKNILDVKFLIDELSRLGTKYIHFTGGGEPFVNDDIFEYLEYCSLKKIKTIIITNGLNLDEKKITRLSKYNIESFFFSIDSSKPSIHDKLRRTPGIWNKAVNNINLIKKYLPSVNVIINHVLNRDNITDFGELITMKKDVNFDYINPIVIKDYASLFPTISQIKKYNKELEHYYLLAKKYNVKFLCENIDFFESDIEPNGDRSKNANLKCIYPSFCSFIDCPTGDVYPCDCSVHRDKSIYKIGCLSENSFTEIWNGEKRKQLQHKLLCSELECKSKCDESNCYFNYCFFEKEGKNVK